MNGNSNPTATTGVTRNIFAETVRFRRFYPGWAHRWKRLFHFWLDEQCLVVCNRASSRGNYGWNFFDSDQQSSQSFLRSSILELAHSCDVLLGRGWQHHPHQRYYKDTFDGVLVFINILDGVVNNSCRLRNRKVFSLLYRPALFVPSRVSRLRPFEGRRISNDDHFEIYISITFVTRIRKTKPRFTADRGRSKHIIRQSCRNLQFLHYCM